MALTAKEQYDPLHDCMYGVATTCDNPCAYHIYKRDRASTRRQLVSSVPTHKPSLVHSFGLSEEFVVIIASPLIIDRTQWNPKAPVLSALHWKAHKSTECIVVEKTTGIIQMRLTMPACFVFNIANTFQTDQHIIVDAVMHADPSIILKNMYLDALRGREPFACTTSRLVRITIDRAHNIVTTNEITPAVVEMPQINPNIRTRAHTYVYAISASSVTDMFDEIIKINMAFGTSLSWSHEGCYPSEPVFVPNPNATQEDDGILLSVVLDTKQKHSFLLVLDAATMTELARAHAPHHIPFGMHGIFLPKT